MLPIGEFRHRVTLENPGDPVPDNEGGFTVVWDELTEDPVRAAIKPASARDLERTVANTTQSTVTHMVTIPYVSGVTTRTRVIFHDGENDRTFSVTGVYDEDERHRQLVLTCVEQVA